MYYSCYPTINRIQFRILREELNYLKHGATLQTNKILITSYNNEIRFCLSPSVNEGQTITVIHKAADVARDCYFAITKGPWEALGVKFAASGSVEVKTTRMIINNIPYLILNKSDINHIPLKRKTKKGLPITPNFIKNNLFHPEDHPVSPVKVTSPLSDLKAALMLVNEAAKNANAKLFVENEVCRAKIETII